MRTFELYVDASLFTLFSQVLQFVVVLAILAMDLFYLLVWMSLKILFQVSTRFGEEIWRIAFVTFQLKR